MADAQEENHQHHQKFEEEPQQDLSQLKKDQEGYRELLLPLNKVLEWKKSVYPAVVVGIITIILAIIWYLEPSVLTSFSLLGIILCMLDFVVSTVRPYFCSSSEWTGVEERQFKNSYDYEESLPKKVNKTLTGKTLCKKNGKLSRMM